jgi:hypothetical protein
MSRVCKPVWVEATGTYGYGYGLGWSNPRPTRTRDAGTAGFAHECYLLNGYSALPSKHWAATHTAEPPTVQYLWR